MNKRIGIAIGAVVIVVLAVAVWLWATAGRETTDDAQVDAHVAPIAARIGGTVTEVPVKENQEVEAGAEDGRGIGSDIDQSVAVLADRIAHPDDLRQAQAALGDKRPEHDQSAVAAAGHDR